MPTSLNPSTIFVHCQSCLQEKPEGVSPADYSRLSLGFTPEADLVVWCLRHDELIALLAQGEIDAKIAEIVQQPCGGCGCKHEHEVNH